MNCVYPPAHCSKYRDDAKLWRFLNNLAQPFVQHEMVDNWDVMANFLLIFVDPLVNLMSATLIFTRTDVFLERFVPFEFQGNRVMHLLAKSWAALLLVVGMVQYIMFKSASVPTSIKLDLLKVMALGDLLHIAVYWYSVYDEHWRHWKLMPLFGTSLLTGALFLLRCVFILGIVNFIPITVTERTSKLSSLATTSFVVGKFPSRPATSEGLRERIKKIQSGQL
jgi:hypothetical protein